MTDVFDEFYKGTDGRKASTTMVFVKMLAKLLRDKEIGKLVVPIVPDEARTFGMESLFRAVGIYSSIGQLYEPVDMDTLLYYKEAKDGQILEEGITEAGSISSFIAAGTAYATHGVNTIPFFIFYSMFGFQRVGDFIWAAADARCRGFLLGGTAGRTTLAGEGLQHQDGNSHTLALTVPTCRAYDPATRTSWRRSSRTASSGCTATASGVLLPHRHERAVRDAGDARGRARRHHQGPVPVPDRRRREGGAARAQLIGSGAILNEVVKAQALLAKYGVAADVWSATSYNELYRDAHRAERWNLLHPARDSRACRTSPSASAGTAGRRRRRVRLPEEPAGHDLALGRPADRHARHRRLRPQRGSRVAAQLLRGRRAAHRRRDALGARSARSEIDAKVVAQAFKDLEINPEKVDPAIVVEPCEAEASSPGRGRSEAIA